MRRPIAVLEVISTTMGGCIAAFLISMPKHVQSNRVVKCLYAK